MLNPTPPILRQRGVGRAGPLERFSINTGSTCRIGGSVSQRLSPRLASHPRTQGFLTMSSNLGPNLSFALDSEDDILGTAIRDPDVYRRRRVQIENQGHRVTKDSTTFAESHSKLRGSSLFKKARDMSLEILGAVSLAMDVILLTFILAWRERRERLSSERCFIQVMP